MGQVSSIEDIIERLISDTSNFCEQLDANSVSDLDAQRFKSAIVECQRALERMRDEQLEVFTDPNLDPHRDYLDAKDKIRKLQREIGERTLKLNNLTSEITSYRQDISDLQSRNSELLLKVKSAEAAAVRTAKKIGADDLEIKRLASKLSEINFQLLQYQRSNDALRADRDLAYQVASDPASVYGEGVKPLKRRS